LTHCTDLLEVDTLKLPKLPQGGGGALLWDWLKFLSAREKEKLTMLTEKNLQEKKTVAKLMVLSEDERARMLAESWEIAQCDQFCRVRGAWMKGYEEGFKQRLKEAREEDRKEICLAAARKLMTLTSSIEEIMDITGLSIGDVLALQDEGVTQLSREEALRMMLPGSGKEAREEEEWEEGRKKGREEAKRSAARNLLGLGQPIDMIAQVTGLSQEAIRACSAD
jgi:hypothetical protein